MVELSCCPWHPSFLYSFNAPFGVLQWSAAVKRVDKVAHFLDGLNWRVGYEVHEVIFAVIHGRYSRTIHKWNYTVYRMKAVFYIVSYFYPIKDKYFCSDWYMIDKVELSPSDFSDNQMETSQKRTTQLKCCPCHLNFSCIILIFQE